MVRDQIDAGPVYPRHIDAVTAAQPQGADILPVEFRFRNHDAPRNQLVVETFPLVFVHIEFLADEIGNQSHIVGRGHDQRLIADRQRSLRTRDVDTSVRMQYAGNNELSVY